jgi:hypothetical protein
MMLMITIGYVFSYLIPTKQRSVVFSIQSTQAFFIAQSGVEFAVRYAKDNSWTTTTLLNSNLNNVTRTLGSGRFTLTYNSGSDTLTSVGEVPSGTSRRKINVSSFTSFLYYFTYRKSFAVKSGQVSSGPHTDFPMLVSVTDANLATVANGGHIASYDATNNDPRDLVFMGLDDNTCNVAGGGTNPCKLSYQIEKYTASTGELVAWVKVPKMYYTSSSDRTVIYMYYGNSCITSSTQDKTGVWDSNYKLVSHMNDVPDTSHVADSTSNGNNGTKRAAGRPVVTTSGKIANAQTFNGTTDYIDTGSASSIDDIFASGGTAEAWIYPTGWGGHSFGRVFDKDNTSAHTAGWWFYINNDDTPTQTLMFGYAATTSYSKWTTPASTLSLNAWQHVAVSFNKSNINNDPSLYINGQAMTVNQGNTGSGSYVSDAAADLNVGNNTNQDRAFAGTIDEVRISNAARTAGWIATEYKNQSAPSSFYSVGGEEN